MVALGSSVNRGAARGTFKPSFRVVAPQPRGCGWAWRTVSRCPGGEGSGWPLERLLVSALCPSYLRVL
jgi:hypothetical protein